MGVANIRGTEAHLYQVLGLLWPHSKEGAPFNNGGCYKAGANSEERCVERNMTICASSQKRGIPDRAI